MKKKICCVIPVLLIGMIAVLGYMRANGAIPITGVTFTPKGYTATDMAEFYTNVKKAGDFCSWAGDWNELGVSGSAPQVVMSLAEQKGFSPIIQVQFFRQADGSLLRPLNATVIAKYKAEIMAFVNEYNPWMLGIGIEVNILYEKDPTSYAAFVQLFSEVLTEVKAVKPTITIFTVFQLEKMYGLSGGLYGGQNNPAANEWALLENFSQADAIGLTTYPSLIYGTPAEIPSDYYSNISLHTDKPIFFTEIGWPSACNIAGWESTETEQTEFIDRFFTLSANVSAEALILELSYDQVTAAPFDSMGLFTQAGVALNRAWEEWTANRLTHPNTRRVI